MKYFIHIFSSIVFALIVFAHTAHAQVTLISPLGSTAPGNADGYLGNLYTIMIVVGIFLAVIRLMICGIQYATSESISSKGAARTCIGYVIGGLALVLIAWLILNTINPALVGGTLPAV